MQLNCTNLCKKYNNKFVVNEIALSLETKKVTGLLGPNGAGKTTTFYMLVGLIKSNIHPSYLLSTFRCAQLNPYFFFNHSDGLGSSTNMFFNG